MTDLFGESTALTVEQDAPMALTADTTNMMSMAEFWAQSTLVPTAFQNKPANCFLALELSNRLNLPVTMVMAGIYVVSGRPAWEAKFLAAISNASGRFSPIRHKMIGTKGQDSYGCIAYFTELSTGEVIEGPEVTMSMAKGLGWTKNPHWVHNFDLMLRYRAESFLIKTTAPELMCGLATREEVVDAREINVTPPREKSAVEAAYEAEYEKQV